MEPRLQKLDPRYASPAVRSIGSPEGSSFNHPRMHHKFLVIEGGSIRGVWTGSFNLTQNATNSLENALFCVDESVVAKYQREFIELYCLSGELKDTWEPGKYFKIGTAVISPNIGPPAPKGFPPTQLPPAGFPPAPKGFPPTQLPPTGFPSAPKGFPPAQLPPTGFPPAPKGFPPTQLAPAGFPSAQLPPAGFPPAQLPPTEPLSEEKPKSRRPPCVHCGKFNHSSTACFAYLRQIKASQEKVPVKEILCNRCGRFDHKGSECTAMTDINDKPI